MSALTWNSGRAAKVTASSSSRSLAAIIQASATSLAWVCAASFGAPVVPPVWNMAARSVERGAGRRTWRRPRRRRARRRSRSGTPAIRKRGAIARGGRRPQREQGVEQAIPRPGRPRSPRPAGRAPALRATSTRAPERPSRLGDVRAGEPCVDRRRDAGELCGERGGDQLGVVGRHQRDGVAAADAEAVQQVRVPVDVGQQPGERPARRFAPPGGVGQDADRRSVGPVGGGPDPAARGRLRQAAVFERDGLDSGQVVRRGVIRPQQVLAVAPTYDRALGAEVDAPSSVAIEASMTSPSCR